MAMKYSPSSNQKPSPVQAQSNELPEFAPRLPRSQSANDAASGVYGSRSYNHPHDPYYYNNNAPQPAPPPQYTHDPYGYNDAYGYHAYAAEQAPNDETAAYHQYHAQQAAMKHAQHHQRHKTNPLPPIYDNAAYNPGYYNTQQQQQNIHRQQQQQQQNIHGHEHDRKFDPYYSPYKPTVDKPSAQKSSSKSSSKMDDDLPMAPTKIQHSKTTGDYFNKKSILSQPMQQPRDLRYELEAIQNRKSLKTKELFDKRKKLTDKSAQQSIANKELEATKKKWNIEREEIIKSYGGKIPSFIIESDKLRRDLLNLSNRNSALQASLEVVSAHLQNELYQLQYQLKIENEISQQTHEHNIELERRVRELRIEKLELETELKQEQDKENDIKAGNIFNKNLHYNKSDDNNNNNKKEYPPESTVIENLLQAQVEFYFSDYNLKRDKRLLSDVTKPPKKGFLKLRDVMKLSRIRQLCSEVETLEEALRRSNVLTLVREEIKQFESEETKMGMDEKNKLKKNLKDEKDEKTKTEEIEIEKYEIWVGRLNFEKPREKEFPFRRTVFIFGIPIDQSKEFLEIMLAPFGNVSKIQFDHSPDGIDRKIGIKFLNKPRVYTLYYYSENNMNMNMNNMNGQPNRREMIFKTSYDLSKNNKNKNDKNENNSKNESDGPNIATIKCHKCGKDKNVSEGFYTTDQWSVIYCAQCAAQLAEDQLNIYYKERNISQYSHNPRHKWLGMAPNDIQNRKTALVVFASQRQASKCAYVRTRIAYNGAFATHFHHYSKVKKEIVLQESNENGNEKENNNKSNKDNNNKNMKQNNKNKQNNNNKEGQQRRRQHNNNNRKNRGRNNNNRRRNYNQQHGGGGYHINYAQQQAAYYSGQQPPQQQQQQHHHISNLKQPKIYRQSSAPTGR